MSYGKNLNLDDSVNELRKRAMLATSEIKNDKELENILIESDNLQEESLSAIDISYLHHLRSGINLTLGFFKEAVTEADKSLEGLGEESYPLFIKGEALYHSGKIEEGMSLLLKSMEINPNNYAIYRKLGLVYAEQGQTDEAIQMFNHLIKMERPVIAEDLIYIKDTLDKYFDMAVAHAHYGLAQIYEEKGDFEQSLSHTQEFTRISSEKDFDYLLLIADLNDMDGSQFISLCSYQKANEGQKFSSQVRFLSSRLSTMDATTEIQKKQKDYANKVLKEVVDANPKNNDTFAKPII